MNLKIPRAFLEAVRLAHAGSLAEAASAVQRALGGDASATPEPVIGADRGVSVARRYSNDAGSRDYTVYVPRMHRGHGLPLVVMLHGCNQEAEDFAAGTQMNVLAEQRGFIAAYPQQCGQANSSRCWNWFEPAHQARERGEPSLIAGMTREILQEFGADRRRVYIAGLSAGGAMAAVMAATYPEIFAAVGIHSGLAYGSAIDLSSALAAMRGDHEQGAASGQSAAGANPPRRVPAIVFHGDRDDTVHPRNADMLLAHAADLPESRMTADETVSHVVERSRTGGREFTRVSYRSASGATIVERWIVHGGTHAWSGGSATGSHSDPLGPDASNEMLRFFLQHETAPL